MLDAAAATRRGRAHQHNDDSFLLADTRLPQVTPLRRGVLYAVCDGVSAVRDGGWAARTSCERLQNFFDRDVDPTLDGLLQLINEIDWELRGRGQGRAACTLSALWLASGMASVIHVGDSEIFWVRHGELHRVTTHRREGRRLRTYMGMGPQLNKVVQVWQEPFFTGDAFMLATDGVLDILGPEDLLDIWWTTQGAPGPCCDDIIGRVEKRRGIDDATAVVVEVLAMETDETGLP